jgi:hypothetical protein
MMRDTYKNRIFSDNDLAKGWLGNRIGIAGRIGPPIANNLKYWADDSVDFLDKSNPVDSHFWDWKPTCS